MALASAKKTALWNLHQWCKCFAAARNESAKGATISPGAYNTTIS